MNLCQRCGYDHERIRQQIANRTCGTIPTDITLCETIDGLEARIKAMQGELTDYGRTVKRLREQNRRALGVISEIADLASHEALEGPPRARYFLRTEK